MAYEAHFINPLAQFGKITFDLILTDVDAILPTIRQNMVFPAAVTNAELITAAELLIDQILLDQAGGA